MDKAELVARLDRQNHRKKKNSVTKIFLKYVPLYQKIQEISATHILEHHQIQMVPILETIIEPDDPFRSTTRID